MHKGLSTFILQVLNSKCTGLLRCIGASGEVFHPEQIAKYLCCDPLVSLPEQFSDIHTFLSPQVQMLNVIDFMGLSAAYLHMSTAWFVFET